MLKLKIFAIASVCPFQRRAVQESKAHLMTEGVFYTYLELFALSRASSYLRLAAPKLVRTFLTSRASLSLSSVAFSFSFSFRFLDDAVFFSDADVGVGALVPVPSFSLLANEVDKGVGAPTGVDVPEPGAESPCYIIPTCQHQIIIKHGWECTYVQCIV